NPEHTGIETPDVIKDTGGPGIALAALVLARMPKPFARETIAGQLADCAPAFQQQRPELLDRICAGQTARPTDHRDVIAELMNQRLHWMRRPTNDPPRVSFLMSRFCSRARIKPVFSPKNAP